MMPTASTPRVAAVITFYDDDRFFPDALASVLGQTRPPDEIVVVDDASPPSRTRTLAQADHRVHLIRHEVNRGAGAARQTGTDATTADLIAYLDADDAWFPDKLERQLAAFDADPSAAAVHCGLVTIRDDGRQRTHVNKPPVLDLASELYMNRTLPSSLMIRRQALAAVGGWSPDRRLMEDWDLGIRLVSGGQRVVFVAEPLVWFRRMNHGNLSSRGWPHTRILLQTIWHHRRVYRDAVGMRGMLAVAGGVLQREGHRRGGLSGRAFRLLGRIPTLVAGNSIPTS
jgi:glycosyltransferase involved in cell wall biosynthesis